MARDIPDACDKCKQERSDLRPTGHTTQWGVYCTVYLCEGCW